MQVLHATHAKYNDMQAVVLDYRIFLLLIG
jgi:hypothetical protein